MSFYSNMMHYTFMPINCFNSCGFNMYNFNNTFNPYSFNFPSFFNFSYQPNYNFQSFFGMTNFNTLAKTENCGYNYSFNSPQINNFNYNTPLQNSWNTSTNFSNYDANFRNLFNSYTYTPNTTSTSTTSARTTSTKSSITKTLSSGLKIDTSYSNLFKSDALRKAQNDARLEELKGGNGWRLAGTFETDIPFAKKGTSRILDIVSKEIGEDLVITSALGTKGTSNKNSPHTVGGYSSHHNAENPKLDIDVNNRADGERLKAKLLATGYFSHIANEGDHLDVQIDPDKYQTFTATA